MNLLFGLYYFLLSQFYASDLVALPNKSPQLVVRIFLDSNQIRLGNDGQPKPLPVGHAGQHPIFNGIAAHYLELAPNAYTPLGGGAVVYHAPESRKGGATAIDFTKSIIRKSGEIYLKIPLKKIPKGEYEWVRLSVSYQNYDITFYYAGQAYTGTIASFVGFNTFIDTYKIKNQMVLVNSNKKQGYWGFESISGVQTGQSPAGATTVPNPLFATSPIPAGSCVITGKFATKLIVDSQPQEHIFLDMYLSTNNSFEWVDVNANGRWDVDKEAGENVVDMGLRGLVPKWTKSLNKSN